MGRSKHSDDPVFSAEGAARKIHAQKRRTEIAVEEMNKTTSSESKHVSPPAKPKPKPSSYAPREGNKKKEYGRTSQPPVINDEVSKKYKSKAK